MAVKLSKSCKARLKRMNSKDRKSTISACKLLADTEIVSAARCAAVIKYCQQYHQSL
jgi:hypothetical protein